MKPMQQRRLAEEGVKKMECPYCKLSVPVGGPYAGEWNILRHSPSNDPTISCEGTDKKIKALP